jgi:hypothetical protein
VHRVPSVHAVICTGNGTRRFLLLEASSFIEPAVAERRAQRIPARGVIEDGQRTDVIAMALAGLFISSLVAAYLRL